MRKKLNVALTWMSEENWEASISLGYLPVLVMNHPKRFSGSPIHFPELSPRLKDLEMENIEESKDLYYDYLVSSVTPWKFLNTLDVLGHLACSSGIMIFTDSKDDPYREVLGSFLDNLLESNVREYDWSRD